MKWPEQMTTPDPMNTDKPRRRIAIISTYDELCGIAGYTRALEKQLTPYADLQIFDLDQYLLRSKHRRVQKLAEAHIQEIAASLHEFDCVNIQLEHGTLGRETSDIIRRFRILANAAPELSVTMHTVMVNEGLNFELLGRFAMQGRLASIGQIIGMAFKARRMSLGIQGFLSRLQRKKKISVIVHAKRDMRLMRDLFGIQNVFHHPLSFISRDDAAAIRMRTSRATFPLAEVLPADAKLIGTFGFLSAYKGFETAIRALKFLPENHHLLIFGGLHPQSIRREEAIDPYIKKLLQAARIGQTPLDHLQESGAAIAPGGDVERLLGAHPDQLRARVHFMGVLSDEDFFSAMALCDAAIFPYVEVGQSSSGPISVALEMGTRIIASRTGAFTAFARYHPNLVEFFDIGNFAELASRIVARGRVNGRIPILTHHTGSNTKIYLQANGANPALVDARDDTVRIAAE